MLTSSIFDCFKPLYLSFECSIQPHKREEYSYDYEKLKLFTRVINFSKQAFPLLLIHQYRKINRFQFFSRIWH